MYSQLCFYGEITKITCLLFKRINYYVFVGELDGAYQLLKNLSTVQRFGTVSMFMSAQEQSSKYEPCCEKICLILPSLTQN